LNLISISCKTDLAQLRVGVLILNLPAKQKKDICRGIAQKKRQAISPADENTRLV